MRQRLSDGRKPGRLLLHRLTLFGLAIALPGIAGCFTTGPLDWIRNGFKVGPNYGGPPAPVAEEWSQGQDARVLSRHLRYGDWWTTFKDPVLTSLVQTAYQQNLNLRIAGARVLQVRGQQAIAVGNIFPQTQQATGQYSRVNLSQNMANNPAAVNAFLSNLPGSAAAQAAVPGSSIPTSYYSDWQTGFNMSWELDFWGRLRRQIESANANLDASVENFDDALVTLLADVATNYVQYRVAQQRIKIAQDNVRIQEAVVKLQEDRLRVGTGNRLDVEQLRTVLEQTRSTIPGLQILLANANDALCTLLGLPVRDLSPELGAGPELGSDPVPNTPGWVAAGIPADLLRRRPDVRSAERQVAAQSAQIGVAEADLYPALFINGTLGFEAQDIAKLFESNSFMGTITPNFRWNILNYGRIRNNVHVQDVRTQELIATYQNRVLTAGQEVENALAGFLRSQEQARTLTLAVKASTTATELALQQFRTGTIDLNRVFNLETTQVQVQDQLAIAQGNVALNLINVYRALGGGWEIRCQPTAGCEADASPTEVPPMQKVEPNADLQPPAPKAGRQAE